MELENRKTDNYKKIPLGAKTEQKKTLLLIIRIIHKVQRLVCLFIVSTNFR